MGKLQSKHVYRSTRDDVGNEQGECFIVNASILPPSSPKNNLDDPIWKPQPGFNLNLSNFSLDQASELAFCLSNKSVESSSKNVDVGGGNFSEDQVPLKVVLPPQKESSVAKVLNFDKDDKSLDEKPSISPTESESDNNPEKPSEGISVEEFECGVSVEGGDKQEWSFTLYDFDGKGKITKEDLGSLMKSLYDAVGSTIQLPPSGMKTLKLKLTVTPEKKDKKENKEESQEPLVKEIPVPLPKINNLNVAKNLERQQQQQQQQKNEQSSTNETSVKCEQVEKEAEKCAAGSSPTTNSSKREVRIGRPRKHKFTSLEQRRLVELVQRNMERHQQKQMQMRRHQGDHRRSADHRTPRHRHHRCSASKTQNASNEVQENQERRNYYLDLAGMDNQATSESLHNTSAPAALLNNSVFNSPNKAPTTPELSSACNSPQTLQTTPLLPCSVSTPEKTAANLVVPPYLNSPQKTPQSSSFLRSKSHSSRSEQRTLNGQLRFKSHGTATAVNNVDDDELERLLKVSESSAEQFQSHDPTCAEADIPKINAVKLPKTPTRGHSSRVKSSTPKSTKHRQATTRASPVPEMNSHHQRRHRHRDRDHQSAMRQVAQWLEKECSLDPGNPGATPTVVQKHEHHHIHEHHHHHHYHHYHET